MSEWRPIDTAPRIPYARLDLWCVRPDGTGYREANAYASGNKNHWLTSNGFYLEGRRYRDEEGDDCFDIDDRSPDALRVTHWMPLPEAPK